MTLVCRAEELFLDEDGHFRIDLLPDCDLFDVRSIAAAAGFKDARYVVNNVLMREGTPFHVHMLRVTDDDGRYLFNVIATHTHSAQAGGQLWDQMQYEQACRRAGAM